jgi:hypothetical protein
MPAQHYARLASVIFFIISTLQLLRALFGWPITVETGAGPISILLWPSWSAFVAFAIFGWLGLDAARKEP